MELAACLCHHHHPASSTGLAMSDEGDRNTSWGRKEVGVSGAGLQGSGKESRKETLFFLWVKTDNSYLSSCKSQGLMTDQSNPQRQMWFEGRGGETQWSREMRTRFGALSPGSESWPSLRFCLTLRHSLGSSRSATCGQASSSISEVLFLHLWNEITLHRAIGPADKNKVFCTKVHSVVGS